MPGATWDMITSGPDAGTVIHPLVYTTTEANSTRVRAWLRLATQLGRYLLGTNQGLDIERILDPRTSDGERADIVRAELLAVDGVVSVESVTVTLEDTDAGPSVAISADATAADGEPFTLGASF